MLWLKTPVGRFSTSISEHVVHALQVHKGFLTILEQGSQAAPSADGEAAMEDDDTAYSAQDSQKAWRSRTLAALGAFLRSHYLHVAAVAVQIEQQLGDGSADDVKQVVMKNVVL